MKNFLLLLFSAANIAVYAQKSDDAINAKDVLRVESVLASDAMRGRRAGTPDIDKAASFIADEFKKAGLQPSKGNSFVQEFSLLFPNMTSLKFEVNGQEGDLRNVMIITSAKDVKVDEKSGYEIHYIKANENLFEKAQTIIRFNKNVVVAVSSSHAVNFSRLVNFKRQIFRSEHSIVFVLTEEMPKQFTIKAEHRFEEIQYSNVVGVLPGKGKKNEYVIFSAHYDHIGIARQPVNGDSIYNGANDDAAGTTAVILLANYFQKLNNNERTIIFAAFTAEESGGFGSQYFSRQFDPAQVVAMFNIEMIGTQSKWGKNSAYITGYDKTNMGAIIQNNLKGSSFSFHPDPYPEQDLFYRSDNATLARLGVPAHTISTAKMDNEPNYHKVTDEVSTLDIENMTEIIKAIAICSLSIVNGKNTPTRVKPESLN